MHKYQVLRPNARREHILKDIEQIDDNLIPQLSEKYGVSEMTIRRDLKVLEDEGYIKRTWGGAVLWPLANVEPAVLSRAKRAGMGLRQKEAIAAYAARHFVEEGDIITMEGGTTVTAMAQFLKGFEDLTVVTNGLYTTDELQRCLAPSNSIICSGGILRPESSTFVGPVAESFFREFNAHRLFLSATGLSLQTGITDPKMLETQVKRAMIASAGEVILLLDSSKFGVKSLMTVIELSRVTALITDSGAPAELVERLRAGGLNVILAPPR